MFLRFCFIDTCAHEFGLASGQRVPPSSPPPQVVSGLTDGGRPYREPTPCTPSPQVLPREARQNKTQKENNESQTTLGRAVTPRQTYSLQ